MSEDMAQRIAALEQHVAELEKSLENARKERDEWRRKAMDAESHPVVVAMRQERDAAIADNAALVNGLRHARATMAALRDTDNPKSRRSSAERGISSADTVLLADHPGAALLEEHRMALVRARNEGLERAARHCIESCPGVAQNECPCDACVLARRIRALKEPEGGCQS